MWQYYVFGRKIFLSQCGMLKDLMHWLEHEANKSQRRFYWGWVLKITTFLVFYIVFLLQNFLIKLPTGNWHNSTQINQVQVLQGFSMRDVKVCWWICIGCLVFLDPNLPLQKVKHLGQFMPWLKQQGDLFNMGSVLIFHIFSSLWCFLQIH